MSDKPLLCLGTGLDFNEVPAVEQIEVMKSVGFDQFFYSETKNQRAADDEAVAEKAARIGIGFHSIHAPFYAMDDTFRPDFREVFGLAGVDSLCKGF